MGDDMRTLLRSIPSLTGAAPPLDQASLPDEPVSLFNDWLQAAIAAEVPEPLAMTLATVDADGVPDARILILKDVDARGWAFAGPTSSAKATQLNAHPAAAMTFWWQPLVRAVRLRGPVVEASRAESEADLHARSPSARVGLTAGDWTVWRLRPVQVEFWQGSTDRRHTRISYFERDVGWIRSMPDG